MLCWQAIVWCNQLVLLLARMLLSLPLLSDLEAAERAAADTRSAECTAEEAMLRQRMRSLELAQTLDQPLDGGQQRELTALEGQLERLRQSQTRGQPVVRMHELTVRHVRRHLLGIKNGTESAW